MTAVVTDNPHETSGVYGGQRIGKRAALNTWALLDATGQASEPVISSVTHTTATTYNANCATTASYSCIDIAFTLNATNGATTLATCGTNLANGTTPPTGACTASGVGAHVEGFRIGVSSTLYYEDGFDPVGQTFSQGKAFSCSIVAATVVECVAPVGSLWPTSGAYLAYGDPYAFSRAGMLFGAANATSLTVTAGSGYTNGTFESSTTGFTGGSCTTQPRINVVVSGGAITAAYPATPGAGCTSNPTITISNTTVPGIGGGTGGAVTLATFGTANGVASAISDNNLMGQALYDNSFASGSLATLFGGYDPGLPVTPYNALGTLAAF